MTTLEYSPPPTVKEFIKHYLPGELFQDWIVGPVGSGKTTGIFMKLVYMAGLQAKSPIDGVRRSRCVIVRSTAPQLADTTIKSFNYWFKDGQAGHWEKTIKNFTLRYGDVECEVMFRPLDTPDDVGRVLSLEVTFAIIDEFVQIPKAIVDALSGRCGRYPPEIEGGATNWGMWGASNPGMESDWWYPFCENVPEEMPEGVEMPENWTNFKQPSGLSDAPENIMNLPGKLEYYTNLIKGKTQHWINQYVKVKWGYSMLGKPVFPAFNPEIHVAKKSLIVNPGLEVVIGYDPGLAGSGVSIQQYDDAHGQLRILDEIVLSGFSTERMIKEKLKPLLRRKYAGCSIVVAPDPASSSRSAAREDTSVVAELRKAGFAVKEDTNNEIDSRLAPMQYYMLRLTAVGAALLIDPGCVRHIRACAGGYKYTVSKGDIQRAVPDKNGHSHVMDGACYGARYIYKGEQRAGRRIEKPMPRQRQQTNYNVR